MKYDGENINEVLEAHFAWVSSGGAEGSRADLSGADLQGMFLVNACLYGANLRGANLYSAVLAYADLCMADLTGANLKEATLNHAQLRGAIGLPHIPCRVPTDGAFIAWKRVLLQPRVSDHSETGIAKLLIPEDARRTSDTNGECRADKAVVLEIQKLDGTPLPGAIAWAIRDRETKYIPGETIVAEDYAEEERFTHWTPGIYFYPDREEAVQYLTKGRDENGVIRKYDWDSIERRFKELNHWPQEGTESA